MSQAATAKAYFSAFLQGLGMPVTQANLNALYGVAQLEGWNDRYNPLNVVQPEAGSSAFNSVGVQTFADFQTGVQGAVTLFGGSHWDGVRQALSRGNDAQGVLRAFQAAYTWDPNVQFPMGDPSWGDKVIGPGAANYNGAAVTTSSNSASSLAGGAPAMTADDYKSALGDLAGLLSAVPELKGILNQAISGGWATSKFQQAIQQTGWWKTHNDAAKSLISLKFQDPAEYKTKLANAQGQVENQAKQLGVNLTSQQLAALTQSFLIQGWDSNALTYQVGRNFNPRNTGQALSGNIATAYDQVKQVYKDYGVPMGEASLRNNALRIAEGIQTIDTYKQQTIANAKSMYPSLAGQLDAGLTVKDIADPYVQQMSSLLELDPNSVGITDPLIKKALQGAVVTTGGKATATSTPLWQFEQQLRSDPRWAKTQNARDTMSSAMIHVGRDFGFGF